MLEVPVQVTFLNHDEMNEIFSPDTPDDEELQPEDIQHLTSNKPKQSANKKKRTKIL